MCTMRSKALEIVIAHVMFRLFHQSSNVQRGEMLSCVTMISGCLGRGGAVQSQLHRDIIPSKLKALDIDTTIRSN